MNRTFEWGVAIATFCFEYVPRHCARLTDFLHPKLRTINAVLITPQPIALPLRRMRRTGSVRGGPGLREQRCGKALGIVKSCLEGGGGVQSIGLRHLAQKLRNSVGISWCSSMKCNVPNTRRWGGLFHSVVGGEGQRRGGGGGSLGFPLSSLKPHMSAGTTPFYHSQMRGGGGGSVPTEANKMSWGPLAPKTVVPHCSPSVWGGWGGGVLGLGAGGGCPSGIPINPFPSRPSCQVNAEIGEKKASTSGNPWTGSPRPRLVKGDGLLSGAVGG